MKGKMSLTARLARTFALMALVMTTFASCTLSYVDGGDWGMDDGYMPSWHETRYEALEDGTYTTRRGGYRLFLDIANGPRHWNDGEVALTVMAEDVITGEYAVVGTLYGHIAHNGDSVEVDEYDGWTTVIHQDEIVFTHSDGGPLRWDPEDLSGVYEITYKHAKDMSNDSDYGHVYVPVPGTVCILESVEGFMADPSWRGGLEGQWIMYK